MLLVDQIKDIVQSDLRDEIDEAGNLLIEDDHEEHLEAEMIESSSIRDKIDEDEHEEDLLLSENENQNDEQINPYN